MGLCCCTQAFSSCDEQGLLFIAVQGLLVMVTSLAERGLEGVDSVLMVHGLSCPVACGIFLDQGRASVPCIARWILNHGTTREAPDTLHF